MTRILNFDIFSIKETHDILSNLTPGHEQEEFGFYAKQFCSILFGLFRYYPELEETFLLCWNWSRRYGSGMLRLRFAIYRFLGSFKYGWVVVALWKRVKRPWMILWDVKRVWRYFTKTSVKYEKQRIVE